MEDLHLPLPVKWSIRPPGIDLPFKYKVKPITIFCPVSHTLLNVASRGSEVEPWPCMSIKSAGGKSSRVSVQLEHVFYFEAIKLNKIKKMLVLFKIFLKIKIGNKTWFQWTSERGQLYWHYFIFLKMFYYFSMGKCKCKKSERSVSRTL